MGRGAKKKNQKEKKTLIRQKGILQYVNFKNKKFKCFSTANQLKFIKHYKYFSQKFPPWGLIIPSSSSANISCVI